MYCLVYTACVYSTSQRAARTGPDRICRIRFPASDSVPFFQRRPGSNCAKPARIRSGWPAQVSAKRIRSGSKPVYKNHRARFLAERNQPATSLPTFRLGCILPQTARIILCKTSPDPICFWLTVSGFGHTDPVRKQAGVQGSLGLLLATDFELVRIGCESDPAYLLGC